MSGNLDLGSLPQWVKNLIFALTGEKPPTANAQMALNAAGVYDQANKHFDKIMDSARQLLQRVGDGMPEAARQQFQSTIDSFTSGRGRTYLRGFQDQLVSVNKDLQQKARDIYDMNWQLLAAVIEMLALLAWVAALALFGFGGLGALQGAIFNRARVAILSVFLKFLQRIKLAPGVFEGFEEALISFATQLANKLWGSAQFRRTSFDWKQVGQDALYGVFAGAIGETFSHGFDNLKNLVTKVNRSGGFDDLGIGNLGNNSRTFLNRMTHEFGENTNAFVSEGMGEALGAAALSVFFGGPGFTVGTFWTAGLSGVTEHHATRGVVAGATWLRSKFVNRPDTGKDGVNTWGTKDPVGPGPDSATQDYKSQFNGWDDAKTGKSVDASAGPDFKAPLSAGPDSKADNATGFDEKFLVSNGPDGPAAQVNGPTVSEGPNANAHVVTGPGGHADAAAGPGPQVTMSAGPIGQADVVAGPGGNANVLNGPAGSGNHAQPQTVQGAGPRVSAAPDGSSHGPGGDTSRLVSNGAGASAASSGPSGRNGDVQRPFDNQLASQPFTSSDNGFDPVPTTVTSAQDVPDAVTSDPTMTQNFVSGPDHTTASPVPGADATVTGQGDSFARHADPVPATGPGVNGAGAVGPAPDGTAHPGQAHGDLGTGLGSASPTHVNGLNGLVSDGTGPGALHVPDPSVAQPAPGVQAAPVAANGHAATTAMTGQASPTPSSAHAATTQHAVAVDGLSDRQNTYLERHGLTPRVSETGQDSLVRALSTAAPDLVTGTPTEIRSHLSDTLLAELDSEPGASRPLWDAIDAHAQTAVAHGRTDDLVREGTHQNRSEIYTEELRKVHRDWSDDHRRSLAQAMRTSTTTGDPADDILPLVAGHVYGVTLTVVQPNGTTAVVGSPHGRPVVVARGRRDQWIAADETPQALSDRDFQQRWDGVPLDTPEIARAAASAQKLLAQFGRITDPLGLGNRDFSGLDRDEQAARRLTYTLYTTPGLTDASREDEARALAGDLLADPLATVSVDDGPGRFATLSSGPDDLIFRPPLDSDSLTSDGDPFASDEDLFASEGDPFTSDEDSLTSDVDSLTSTLTADVLPDADAATSTVHATAQPDPTPTPTPALLTSDAVVSQHPSAEEVPPAYGEEAPPAYDEGALPAFAEGERAPRYDGRKISWLKGRELAKRLGVDRHKLERVNRYEWFDASEADRLRTTLKLKSADAILDLAEDIGRVPTDLPEIAADLGVEPVSLLKLSRELGADPANVAVVLGQELLTGGPERAGQLRNTVASILGSLHPGAGRQSRGRGWLIAVAAAHGIDWQGLTHPTNGFAKFLARGSSGIPPFRSPWHLSMIDAVDAWATPRQGWGGYVAAWEGNARRSETGFATTPQDSLSDTVAITQRAAAAVDRQLAPRDTVSRDRRIALVQRVTAQLFEHPDRRSDVDGVAARVIAESEERGEIRPLVTSEDRSEVRPPATDEAPVDEAVFDQLWSSAWTRATGDALPAAIDSARSLVGPLRTLPPSINPHEDPYDRLTPEDKAVRRVAYHLYTHANDTEGAKTLAERLVAQMPPARGRLLGGASIVEVDVPDAPAEQTAADAEQATADAAQAAPKVSAPPAESADPKTQDATAAKDAGTTKASSTVQDDGTAQDASAQDASAKEASAKEASAKEASAPQTEGGLSERQNTYLERHGLTPKEPEAATDSKGSADSLVLALSTAAPDLVSGTPAEIRAHLADALLAELDSEPGASRPLWDAIDVQAQAAVAHDRTDDLLRRSKDKKRPEIYMQELRRVYRGWGDDHRRSLAEAMRTFTTAGDATDDILPLVAGHVHGVTLTVVQPNGTTVVVGAPDGRPVVIARKPWPAAGKRVSAHRDQWIAAADDVERTIQPSVDDESEEPDRLSARAFQRRWEKTGLDNPEVARAAASAQDLLSKFGRVTDPLGHSDRDFAGLGQDEQAARRLTHLLYTTPGLTDPERADEAHALAAQLLEDPLATVAVDNGSSRPASPLSSRDLPFRDIEADADEADAPAPQLVSLLGPDAFPDAGSASSAEHAAAEPDADATAEPDADATAEPDADATADPGAASPATVTDPSVVPATVTDPSVVPETVTDPSVVPETVTDPSVVEEPPVYEEGPLPQHDDGERAPGYDRRKISWLKGKQLARRLGVDRHKLVRVNRQEWFDASEVDRLRTVLKLKSANAILDLAEDIGRVPTDLPEIAANLGVEPVSLLRLSRELGADPAHVAVVLGQELLTGGPERAGQLRNTVASTLGSLHPGAGRNRRGRGWLIAVAAAHGVDWQGLTRTRPRSGLAKYLARMSSEIPPFRNPWHLSVVDAVDAWSNPRPEWDEGYVAAWQSGTGDESAATPGNSLSGTVAITQRAAAAVDRLLAPRDTVFRDRRIALVQRVTAQLLRHPGDLSDVDGVAARVIAESEERGEIRPLVTSEDRSEVRPSATDEADFDEAVFDQLWSSAWSRATGDALPAAIDSARSLVGPLRTLPPSINPHEDPYDRLTPEDKAVRRVAYHLYTQANDTEGAQALAERLVAQMPPARDRMPGGAPKNTRKRRKGGGGNDATAPTGSATDNQAGPSTVSQAGPSTDAQPGPSTESRPGPSTSRAAAPSSSSGQLTASRPRLGRTDARHLVTLALQRWTEEHTTTDVIGDRSEQVVDQLARRLLTYDQTLSVAPDVDLADYLVALHASGAPTPPASTIESLMRHRDVLVAVSGSPVAARLMATSPGLIETLSSYPDLLRAVGDPQYTIVATRLSESADMVAVISSSPALLQALETDPAIRPGMLRYPRLVVAFRSRPDLILRMFADRHIAAELLPEVGPLTDVLLSADVSTYENVVAQLDENVDLAAALLGRPDALSGAD
ncbi:hypothetical protein ACGFYV_34750, partial [Streptomyces sp. NPDC048297]|uniref:hypothetical protein n=1 Tax=Streptomyces sp. NPDC048297 TaxID=3365531 RepID=UPI003718CD7A